MKIRILHGFGMVTFSRHFKKGEKNESKRKKLTNINKIDMQQFEIPEGKLIILKYNQWIINMNKCKL